MSREKTKGKADRKETRFELLKLEWQQRGEEIRQRIALSFKAIYFKLLVLGAVAFYYFSKIREELITEEVNRNVGAELLIGIVGTAVVVLFCLDLFLVYNHALIRIQGDSIQKKLNEYDYTPFRGREIGYWSYFYRICHGILTALPMFLLYLHSMLAWWMYLIIFFVITWWCILNWVLSCRKPEGS
ncbi:MAG: hypothetical protein ACE5KK_02625 [Candidatus Brocadiales bacterium]